MNAFIPSKFIHWIDMAICIYTLFPLQSYYYLVMETKWREENDWIHRDKNNRLLPLFEAVQNCSSQNMQTKIDCSAEMVQNFSKILPQIDRMKQMKPDEEMLKRNLNVLLVKSVVSKEQHNKALWSFNEFHSVLDKMKDEVRHHKNKNKKTR